MVYIVCVPASADWFGQYDSCRVNGLKNAFHMNAPRDFTNQYGCHSFGTKFFVNAEEIDFYHFLLTKFRDIKVLSITWNVNYRNRKLLIVNSYCCWDSWNKTKKFSWFFSSDTTMPIFLPTRRLQCPVKLNQLISQHECRIPFRR